MLDRFEDIKGLVGKDEINANQKLLSDYDQEENKGELDTQDRKLIQDFLPKTRKLIELIKKMETSNAVIRELKDVQIQEARNDREKAASDRIQKIIQETQGYQTQINESLKEMWKSVEDIKEENSKEPECRVMASIHSTISVKFREVLVAFQQSQTDYKNAVQAKIKRQIQIVKPDADEEEVNELAKDPEAANALLSQQISGKVHRKVQNAVDDIQSKYQVILKLERSVEEVYQLFLDLNTLIQEQGEMLNTIENNLEVANNYVEKAEGKLKLAKKWHQQTRYKMACIVVCVLIIGIILMIIFLK